MNARRGFAAALAAIASAAAIAAPCDVTWRIRPRVDATPRHLDVEVSWNAGDRRSSAIRIVREWGGVDDYATRLTDWRTANRRQSLSDGTGDVAKIVHHAPNERVVVRYRVGSSVADPDAGAVKRHDVYSALVGADWFHFTGYAAFAVPQPYDEARAPMLCITLEAPRRRGWVVTSHGASRTGTAIVRSRGPAEKLWHALYLGGAFDVRETRIAGNPLYVARRGDWTFDADAFAAAANRIIATHRAFWNDFAFDHFAIELLPTNLPQGESGGTGLGNAFAMYGSRDFTVPGDAFDFLVGHEHLHTWIPHRFGAMGKDEALHYWFSEGFTDFYTHRLLVNSGVWTLDAYAAALNRKISRYLASPAHAADNRRVLAQFFSSDDVGRLPYQRGELLALRWHAELSQRGHAGVDALMRALLLDRDVDENATPAPPLATTRLLDEADRLLAGAARQDVERFVERGESYPVDERTLGPCFTAQWVTQPARWRLGFDRASLASRVVSGVEPDGPAHRAGLRDGQPIVSYSVHGGDVGRDSVIAIRADDGTTREIAYRPGDGEVRAPVFGVRTGAAQDEACRRWFGLAPDQTFAPSPPLPGSLTRRAPS